MTKTLTLGEWILLAAVIALGLSACKASGALDLLAGLLAIAR